MFSPYLLLVLKILCQKIEITKKLNHMLYHHNVLHIIFDNTYVKT